MANFPITGQGVTQLAFSDISGTATSAQGGLGVASGYPIMLGGTVANVDLNSANTDNTINITLPSGITNYLIHQLVLRNHGTTASLTTVTYGVFSAAGGGGTAIVNGGSVLTAVTSNVVNTQQNLALINTSVTIWCNFSSIFFRVQNAQGASASADVYCYIRPLP